MLPDRVSNPGPLTYESGALPIALCGPAQDVASTFQATIGGKFAQLINLGDDDLDIASMIATYNTAVTDTASEILGKERLSKKPG